MIQPVIARKPKFVINPQRSPTLGFGLDTPRQAWIFLLNIQNSAALKESERKELVELD